MARRKPEHKSRRARLKTLPWAAMLQSVMVVGRHWRALSERDRARLTGLVRESQGRLGNLSTREREELRRLVGKLDLKGIGRDLVLVARGRQLRRGRRRGRSA